MHVFQAISQIARHSFAHIHRCRYTCPQNAQSLVLYFSVIYLGGPADSEHGREPHPSLCWRQKLSVLTCVRMQFVPGKQFYESMKGVGRNFLVPLRFWTRFPTAHQVLVKQPLAQSIHQVALIKKKTNNHAQIVAQRLPTCPNHTTYTQFDISHCSVHITEVSIRWDCCNVIFDSHGGTGRGNNAGAAWHASLHMFCWIIHADPTFNLDLKEPNKGLLMEATRCILESPGPQEGLVFCAWSPSHQFTADGHYDAKARTERAWQRGMSVRIPWMPRWMRML